MRIGHFYLRANEPCSVKRTHLYCMRLNLKVTYQNGGSTEFWTLGSRFPGKAEGGNVASWEQRALFTQVDSPMQRSSTKGTEGNRSHPKVYIDFVSKGLWTPSDVSRCTMSDQEGSPAPAYKIPFAQGGRTWHKFIAETRCTSLPPSWLIKVVMRSKSSLQIQ